MRLVVKYRWLFISSALGYVWFGGSVAKEELGVVLSVHVFVLLVFVGAVELLQRYFAHFNSK